VIVESIYRFIFISSSNIILLNPVIARLPSSKSIKLNILFIVGSIGVFAPNNIVLRDFNAFIADNSAKNSLTSIVIISVDKLVNFYFSLLFDKSLFIGWYFTDIIVGYNDGEL
jgi:hypothetical protein